MARRRAGALGAARRQRLSGRLVPTLGTSALPPWAVGCTVSERPARAAVVRGLLRSSSRPMLLPAGLLGDRYGRKKLLLSPWWVFGVDRWPAPTRPRGAAPSPPRPAGARRRFSAVGWSRDPSAVSEDERQRATHRRDGHDHGGLRSDRSSAAGCSPTLVGSVFSHQRAGDRRRAGGGRSADARIAQQPPCPIDYVGVLLSSVGLTVLATA